MKKIVVIDEPETARAIRYDFGLRTEGARRTYEIILPDPGTGLAVIETEKPDMVIVNPTLDDWQLVMQLRADSRFSDLLITVHGPADQLADPATYRALRLNAQVREPYDFFPLASAIHLVFGHAGGT